MADSAGDQSGEPEGTEDDVKRRFKEALDRKRDASRNQGGGGPGKSGSKVRGTHDRADHQKQFRRKSG